MDLAERNRLTAVTKGYQQLQGLIYAPMGLSVLGNSLINRAWPMNSLALMAEFAILSCALAAMIAAMSYYRRRFGVVRPKCPGGLNAVLLTVGTIVWLIPLFGAMYMDASRWTHPATSYPVSFTC